MIDYLRQEFLRAAVVGDGALGGRGNHDGDVAGGVEVVLVPQHLTRELHLLAGVPLGGDGQLEPIALIWQEIRVGLRLPEHVSCTSATAITSNGRQQKASLAFLSYIKHLCCLRFGKITSFAIGGIGRRDLGTNCCGTDEHGQSQAARDDRAVLVVSGNGLLLLGPAGKLVSLDARHEARPRGPGGGGRGSRVVEEARSRGHLSLCLSFTHHSSLRDAASLVALEGAVIGFYWICGEWRRTISELRNCG